MRITPMVALAALLLSSAACTSSSTASTTSSSTTHAASTAGNLPPVTQPPAPPVAAGIGATVHMRDLSGNRFDIVLTSVKTTSATGALSDVPHGDELLAADFAITGRGPGQLDEAPALSADLIDASGQQYQPATIDQVAAGPELPGEVTAGTGETRTGWVPFTIPAGTRITEVEWQASSGIGNATAKWVT